MKSLSSLFTISFLVLTLIFFSSAAVIPYQSQASLSEGQQPPIKTNKSSKKLSKLKRKLSKVKQGKRHERISSKIYQIEKTAMSGVAKLALIVTILSILLIAAAVLLPFLLTGGSFLITLILWTLGLAGLLLATILWILALFTHS